MASKMRQDIVPEELDFDEVGITTGINETTKNENESALKGSYSSIHSCGFKDFLLKPELLRAITDCGFEHPSEGV